jgi:hypothetical protein
MVARVMKRFLGRSGAAVNAAAHELWARKTRKRPKKNPKKIGACRPADRPVKLWTHG